MTQPSDLQGYRDGLAEGELRGQRCTSCKRHQWPPRPACSHCRSFETEWVPLPATAFLYTWTVIHRTTLPGFEERTPYAVGVLEFTDRRIRVVGQVAEDPATLQIGEQLAWSVEPSFDGSPVPVWRRVEEAAR